MLSRFICVAAITLAGLVQPFGRAEESPSGRPLRDLNESYFPFTPVASAAEWKVRRNQIQRRLLVAAGLYPLPQKTPLNPVIHGRIEKNDYTVEKVLFESLPGHFVTGNLYLPKNIKGKIPAVICPHGHWPNGRFMNETDNEVKKQIAMKAEVFESAAHSPLQARCVQLARMGCAVFFYDMLGYADSIQFTEHRHGPKSKGFVSAEAELNLVSYFGLQTWNSVRVVDFISSLPYVDPSGIACTGASGGGTQTMMITGMDDRIAAAFPCVMVSTAMQGGCTCENASYLRIDQGNIDLAALTAPRPLGMTAADDWTKELETKGFPDVKRLYAILGVPDRVEAHFNIQFPHNYNAVSRAQMYAFVNKHLKLGLKDLHERDFDLLSARELSVWDEQHPKPSGDQVGEAHEVAVVDWFKKQAATQINPLLQPGSKAELRRSRELLGGALQIMIGRSMPRQNEVTLRPGEQSDKQSYLLQRGKVAANEYSVDATFVYPTNWNRNTVLWLTMKGERSVLRDDGQLTEPARQLLDQGYALVCPRLYQLGTTRNPNVYDNGKRNVTNSYEGFAAYHYGYNRTLVAERISDALAVLAAVRDNKQRHPRHITVAGVEGAGLIAAGVVALVGRDVDRLICDTEGFRFAKLDNVWDANFVPGAAKYGDLPAWLALCAPVKTTIINETRDSMKAVVAAFAISKVPVKFARATTEDSLKVAVEEIAAAN